MKKFTISVITIIDKYQDKLPYLYESLIVNTENGINVFWNIYCNEDDVFAKEILSNFEDLDESRTGGFLKIKIIYGNLNRFDAEDECLKHSFGDVVVNAYPDAVFIKDAFKKVEENIFFLKDIYGFAFLEKNMKEYLVPNENIKILDLMLNEEKFNIPIFFNLNIRKKVKNHVRSLDDDIPREVPNLSYLDLDKFGYIFALNIPIVQNINDYEDEQKVDNEEEDDEDLIKQNITNCPKTFKLFYERIFTLGRRYFKKHNISLNKHISRYIYALYILNQKPNLNKIEDKMLKANIRFKYIIKSIIYKIKNRNTEDKKTKDKNIEKNRLKERYLALMLKDKSPKEEGLTKLASLSRGEKIDTKLSNIDFEVLNEKEDEYKNENKEIKTSEIENNIKETKKIDIKTDTKKELENIEKTKAFNFEELNSSSDYTNYIKNMNNLRNKNNIIANNKDKDKQENEEIIVKVEKEIEEESNNSNKKDPELKPENSNLNFDFILEKTLVTKQISNIKEKRKTKLADKLVYSDVSKNTLEQNLEILKELEKEEKRLIEEKERLKKTRAIEKENERINAWNNYINSHFKDIKENNNDNNKEKQNKDSKEGINIINEETNTEPKKRELKALNEDGSVKILDNLEDKKQKYLELAKSKKKETLQVEDYLFGEEFN